MSWSTLIFGGIGTPLSLVSQQITWWFKVHLSRKAHVSRTMLISKLECWWTKFNVELSLIKLNSKVLTIALRTTKLTCKVECWSLSSQMLHSQVECCDLLWFVAGMELHKFIQLFLESFWESCKRQSRNALCFREIWHEESSVKSIDEKATKNKCESYIVLGFTQIIYLHKIVYFLIS